MNHKQVFSKQEIKDNKLKCVDLGCGKRKKPGYIGIDVRPFKEVDFQIDIEKDKFPFKDNSIDAIDSESMFEHLTSRGLFHCIDECWRVLKPKGQIRITVPKFPCGISVLHPDHKRFFIPDTFSFFQVPADGIDPHGYLNGRFWHVSILSKEDDIIISVIMYPNKKNGVYEYKKILE